MLPENAPENPHIQIKIHCLKSKVKRMGVTPLENTTPAFSG